MRFIKNIWISLLGLSLFALNFGYCISTWLPKTEYFNPDSTPFMSGDEIEDINEWWKTFSERLEWILSIPQKDKYSTSLWYVTTLIQVIINWLLWILSFVALVYMLYCGFLVLSSGSDDKNASKGKKWISTAAIALAWIGLSWLIISAMIRFINNIT